ncbi:hypothetical protein BDV98DRAFT_110925 [Pterulicium gracile]|uniref:Uncharacterized protein n=1 Tax=Pterulicium gracile TaxID=1884261 RepID=A0A5C3QG91_9AGAR|nr:hypothetical protein BDV98DRAFT_110925 [Pterula gracilis]
MSGRGGRVIPFLYLLAPLLSLNVRLACSIISLLFFDCYITNPDTKNQRPEEPPYIHTHRTVFNSSFDFVSFLNTRSSLFLSCSILRYGFVHITPRPISSFHRSLLMDAESHPIPSIEDSLHLHLSLLPTFLSVFSY